MFFSVFFTDTIIARTHTQTTFERSRVLFCEPASHKSWVLPCRQREAWIYSKNVQNMFNRFYYDYSNSFYVLFVGCRLFIKTFFFWQKLKILNSDISSRCPESTRGQCFCTISTFTKTAVWLLNNNIYGPQCTAWFPLAIVSLITVINYNI